MNQRYKIQLHPYHLVAVSPWPLITSFSLFNIAVGAVLCFHGELYGNWAVVLGFLSTLSSIVFWFRDVAAEGSFLGEHTQSVQNGLLLGFYLFVLTEVIFFVSLFWSYLHSALSPTIEIGIQWPPSGIEAIDPLSLPLFNTFLLLGSGAAVTYSHHAIIGANRYGTLFGIIITIILAILFTLCQLLEYYNSNLSIADSVYGASFFLSTGFHGLHVIIGTVFLAVGGWRIYTYQCTLQHHVGLESAIIYWHLVDVVWLLLFSLIYVWASL